MTDKYGHGMEALYKQRKHFFNIGFFSLSLLFILCTTSSGGHHNLNLYVWGWNILLFKKAYVFTLRGIYIWWYEEQFYGAAQRAGVIPPCLIPQSTHNNQTNTFTNNGQHFPLDNQNNHVHYDFTLAMCCALNRA